MKNSQKSWRSTGVFCAGNCLLLLGAATGLCAARAPDAASSFGPSNPFYAASSLEFHAPAFDKIKDSDYQPAIDAGMAEQLKEVEAIANDPAPPTFENTFVPLEKSGQLFNRAWNAFNLVSQANTDPELEKVEDYEAPRTAALADAINLNSKLFARIKTIYDQRASLKLDTESRRLVEYDYQQFVKAGANLSDGDKEKLKKLDEEESTLENTFMTKLLDATTAASYSTTDPGTLAGLSAGQMASAAEDAKAHKQQGWLLPQENTTQQPDLSSLSDRATRHKIFENSWNRAERGDANDTRSTLARLAQLRAQKAALLGYPNYAAWVLTDQMAKTPEAAIHFLDALVPATTAKAAREAKDIQALDDFKFSGSAAYPVVDPADWEFYAEQVRKAKYDYDQSQVKPYFELNDVLENGVFLRSARALRLDLQGAQGSAGLAGRCARVSGL
ncbi:MAG: M3 family metallopeptidase [Terracidiphilus sp.]